MSNKISSGIVCERKSSWILQTLVYLIMIMIMIMIEIQGKGTACRPDRYILDQTRLINYKNIYLFSLK